MTGPEVLAVIVGGTLGAGQLALLTGIFFRLGRGAQKFEELFRRIAKVEERLLDHFEKGR